MPGLSDSSTRRLFVVVSLLAVVAAVGCYNGITPVPGSHGGPPRSMTTAPALELTPLLRNNSHEWHSREDPYGERFEVDGPVISLADNSLLPAGPAPLDHRDVVGGLTLVSLLLLATPDPGDPIEVGQSLELVVQDSHGPLPHNHRLR